MNSEVFLFIGIMVFLFIAWAVTGGPSRPISFAGPYITPITGPNTVQQGYGSLPNLNGGSSSNGSSGSDSRDSSIQTPEQTRNALEQAQRTLADLQRQAHDARLFGDPSPYKGQVSIRRSNLSETDPAKEYVSIYVSGRTDVNITGWRVTSLRTDTTAVVPQGVEVLTTNGVPSTAQIVLHPGEEANLVTGVSPVGVSFKQNVCSGYLAQTQIFTPSMNTRCPDPVDDFARFYTGNDKSDRSCSDYVKTIYNCKVPIEKTALPQACIAFADTYLNYNGCVAAHRNDTNFENDSWYIYFGFNEPSKKKRQDLWDASHDTLKLLDANGKTVDTYEY